MKGAIAMKIKEICEKLGITKKAIEYYEQKGLIKPEISANGYREYTHTHLQRLKEICVLRRCNVSISDITKILDSKDKKTILQDILTKLESEAKQLLLAQERITKLAVNYDIEQEFLFWNQKPNDFSLLKEKLLYAFPGGFGKFLNIHFGQFLNEKIDTPEKEHAYQEILTYLDNVNFYMTDEFNNVLEQYNNIYCDEMALHMIQSREDMLKDTESYLENNKQIIQDYLAFKNSEEYQNSPFAQMMDAVRSFQETSGYQKHLVQNMKIISRSYTQYFEKLESANKAFFDKFPETKNIQ